MSENEQKPEATSPPAANDQSAPKIDFGIDEKPHTAPSSGPTKDMGPEKVSGSDTKPKHEKDGASAKDTETNAEPKKDLEAKRDAEANKNAETRNEDESNKKLRLDVEEQFEQRHVLCNVLL